MSPTRMPSQCPVCLGPFTIDDVRSLLFDSERPACFECDQTLERLELEFGPDAHGEPGR